MLAAAVCGGYCGSERWAVKTLSDRAAYSVSYAPHAARVSQLVRLTPAYPAGGRGLGAERTLFEVRACLSSYKRETDRDFHLVIADPATHQTMIAEIPSAQECSGACAYPWNARKYVAARQFVEARYGEATGRFRNLNPQPLLDVSGVGFFDTLHGQRGVAPNGIELHPVLRLRQLGWCGA